MPYVYDNASPEEQERLASLEANLDPPTIAVLRERGVDAGWKCWDAGAGAGSVARWLRDRVGPTGSVVASDVDTTLLEVHAGPDVAVIHHDVTRDAPPSTDFDLVHARLVLEHLAERDTALACLVAACAPGGWVVVEDSVTVGLTIEPPSPLFASLSDAWTASVADAGWDTQFGRSLIPRLRAAGLEAVGARVHQGWHPPGPAWTAYRISLRRLRERLVATGLVTLEQLDEIDAILCGTEGSSDVTIVAGGVLSAWGRKPRTKGAA